MKAKLVIDMPENCIKCDLSYYAPNDYPGLMATYLHCFATHKNMVADTVQHSRAEDCPLEEDKGMMGI